MSVKCAACGRFISYDDMEKHLATFYHEPSSHFGPEISEWTCNSCTVDESLEHEEQLATAGVMDR